MEESCVGPEDLTVELAAELARGEERRTLEPHKCANIARRFTEHLIEIGVATAAAPTPKQIAREALRHGYEEYLRRERGLSERSRRPVPRHAAPAGCAARGSDGLVREPAAHSANATNNT
jgi:hypothetical protein